MKKKIAKPTKSKKEQAESFGKSSTIEQNTVESIKLGTPMHSSTAFVNKIFYHKDGYTTTVTYSGCKDKPIEIRKS